jgi:hypothetical protein
MSAEEFNNPPEDSPAQKVPPPKTKRARKAKANGQDAPPPEAEAKRPDGEDGDGLVPEIEARPPNGKGQTPDAAAASPPEGDAPPPDAVAEPAGQKAKAKAYKPPADAADLSGLFVDTEQGDPLTETIIHAIAVDKPKDFFRVHPDPSYRRRCYVYTLKIEGQVEEHNYIVAEPMRDMVPEAKLCLVTTCIYRNGTLRLWLLKLPREGEKDQMAWSTARVAARDALTKWTKIVWVGSKYDTRSALEGYAPDPDVSKIPPFERLVELAFGTHGVIRDESHPVYREQILGAAKEDSGDDLA